MALDCQEVRSEKNVITERNRAKDLEQFDDILRNVINETNKTGGRFGKIRDVEKTLAVKKLMPESLLNCRFRRTTLLYEELLTALENIIMDKVTTLSAGKGKKTDTSAPLEVGMAAGINDDEALEEIHGRASKQSTRGKEQQVDCMVERAPIGVRRGTSMVAKERKERIVQERDSGPRLEERKEEKDKRR